MRRESRLLVVCFLTLFCEILKKDSEVCYEETQELDMTETVEVALVDLEPLFLPSCLGDPFPPHICHALSSMGPPGQAPMHHAGPPLALHWAQCL